MTSDGGHSEFQDFLSLDGDDALYPEPWAVDCMDQGEAFPSPSVTTPLEALAAVITRSGLPQGVHLHAPAWSAAAERFAEAMEPLLGVYVSHMLASYDTTQLYEQTKNPADAQYVVAQLVAFAARSTDPHDAQSAQTMARGISMAAQDAAVTAVVGIQELLVAQIDVVYQQRSAKESARRDLDHAESWTQQTLDAVKRAAPLPGSAITVSVVMQAIRDVLEQHGDATGNALMRRFYSAVVSRASAFGASQPLRLVDASRVGLEALQSLHVGAPRANALTALCKHDFGRPLAIATPSPNVTDTSTLSRPLTSKTK
ncbi:hypothetical protein pmac_cds_560 [Pandoravirus macleodensis]|uniref:Uncharacterized protein n=1 Tax=Pandoravirus macleodensis TaxID=2107707 RepID=A0A2U7UFI6_9VIRU|nr:hypothetical protein pmac_cds_560 [Pandoravirus macleodensis]AVK77248.1 hypothetical protein pmac_cds_560 [Pandoravirus macleodensis]